MSDGTSPIARTKHGELSLDQLADMQPGMARLMVEVSDRYWVLYYAAKGGNWELARHEFGELRKTLRIAAVVRPKYVEPLERFEATQLAAIEATLKARDWPAFEAAYRAATDAANALHRELGYPYIEWRLPGAAPQHLRLEA